MTINQLTFWSAEHPASRSPSPAVEAEWMMTAVNWRRAAAVLFNRQSLSRHAPPSRGTPQEIAGTIAGGARKSSGYSLDDIPMIAGALTDPALTGEEIPGAAAAHILAFGGNNTSGPINVAAALNACHTKSGRQDFGTETFIATVAPTISAANWKGDGIGREELLIAHTLRGEGFDASEDGTGRGIPLVPLVFNSRQDPVCGVVAGSLDCASPQAQAISWPYGVRRLTPLECERLMGFPDGWTEIIYRGKMAADSPRYCALGNSMAVPVMAWIGRRIDWVEQHCAPSATLAAQPAEAVA